MFNSIYKDKKVLLTGHTGFKGSWLSIWLKELGADIFGYALDPLTREDVFVRSKLSEKIKDVRGDLRNRENLNSLVKEFDPDIIFHLAAQPIVRESYINPLETYEVNIQGTINILEIIRNNPKIEAAIFITTDKVYENKEIKQGYQETDRLGGFDPYSASKACCELIIDSYRKSFFRNDENFQKIASVRAGNVIGGGDWQADRLIPDCIKYFSENKPISIRNPYSTRPWQHVIEALGGYLLLGQKLLEKKERFDQGWNFGPLLENIVSVLDLVNLCKKYWGNGEIIINSAEEDRKHETKTLFLDITKAKSELNWHPILTLDEMMQETIEWYKIAKNEPKKDLYDFSVNQIFEYCKNAKERGYNWMNY